MLSVIAPDSSAAESMSPKDLEARQAAWKEKKAKLKNPNYVVSKTRLSIRNLPLRLDDKALKSLCLAAVKDYWAKQNEPTDQKIRIVQVIWIKPSSISFLSLSFSLSFLFSIRCVSLGESCSRQGSYGRDRATPLQALWLCGVH
jgi:hypothetical protein